MQRRVWCNRIREEALHAQKKLAVGQLEIFSNLRAKGLTLLLSYDMYDVVCFPSVASRATVNLAVNPRTEKTVCRWMLVMGRAENAVGLFRFFYRRQTSAADVHVIQSKKKKHIHGIAGIAIVKFKPWVRQLVLCTRTFYCVLLIHFLVPNILLCLFFLGHLTSELLDH